ncbi:hypothetical protein CWO91_23030 [Bradyrhizobium genosp. SA-3]|nr:hypothetical protein CWO91_23030 [Bradyrhizobium genosp. SA-3]
MDMSNRSLSALVAGAFVTAVASLAVAPAAAQMKGGMEHMGKGDMEKMMKEKQAETAKALK